MKIGNSLANENQLKFNSNESENLLKKLASARRINSAAEDAAGELLNRRRRRFKFSAVTVVLYWITVLFPVRGRHAHHPTPSRTA